MRWKSFIEIDLPDSIDAFDVLEKVKKTTGIMAVNAVTAQKLRIKYDSRRIEPDEIICKIKLAARLN